MKKRNAIIVVLIIAVFSWLYVQLLSDLWRMSDRVFSLEHEITLIRKHDITQDRMIGEVAIASRKPAQVIQQPELPTADIPQIVPIPFYVGVVEAVKRFIFR